MTKMLSLLLALTLSISAFGIGVDRNIQTTIQNFIPITNAQMVALPAPEAGDVIWNSTDGSLYFHDGTNWIATLSGPVNLVSGVSGILPTSSGGTGLSSAGTIGNVLTSDGSNWISSPASGFGDVDGPASSVDGEVALFDGVTGKLIKSATGTGVAHLISGVLSASNVNLSSEVTGVLPRANGGTGLSIAGSIGNVLTSDGTDWISSALPIYIDELNGLTATQQYFANGSTGTAPAFSSVTDTHTLNIPLASGAGVTSGTISKANYDAFTAKVDGPASSVDGEIVLFDATTGKLIKAATGSGVVHSVSGVYSVSNVNLASEVTGILPVANGGTGLSASGSANKVLTSNGTIWSSEFVAYANVTGTPTNLSDFTNDVGFITTYIPSIFGTRAVPRNIQTAGITTAGSHMNNSVDSQDIYVCGSSTGASCDANVTLTTINAGTIDGQRMCIVGRGVQASQKVTINAGSTTNVELNGNAVLYAGRTICLRYDLTNWSEVSRNF